MAANIFCHRHTHSRTDTRTRTRTQAQAQAQTHTDTYTRHTRHTHDTHIRHTHNTATLCVSVCLCVCQAGWLEAHILYCTEGCLSAIVSVLFSLHNHSTVLPDVARLAAVGEFNTPTGRAPSVAIIIEALAAAADLWGLVNGLIKRGASLLQGDRFKSSEAAGVDTYVMLRGVE